MKRILVRAPQWLGDAVVSTVFLTRLRARFPNADITVLCPSALAPLYDTHPAKVTALSLTYPTGSVFDVARRLREEAFDTAYILPRSFRTALEVTLAKIPNRIGFTGELFRGLLLTNVIRYDDKLLYPHRYLKLLGEETFALDQAKPYFPKADLSDKEAQMLFFQGTPPLKKPILGIAPVSVAPARTWEPDHFAAVAEAFLKERSGTVFLFGSPAETAAVERVAAMIQGRVVNLAGKLDLPKLGWAMSLCDAFLGNDSGLMHVAAAFKIPSVILFGPSDPTHAVPPWGMCKVIQKREINCVPCLRNECVRFGPHYRECLKSIGAAEVIKSLG